MSFDLYFEPVVHGETLEISRLSSDLSSRSSRKSLNMIFGRFGTIL
jgi:hypothetical protein